jgi:hypothetical protein
MEEDAEVESFEATVIALQAGVKITSAGVDPVEDGSYTLSFLTEGTYEVTVEVPEGFAVAEPDTIEVVVLAGEETSDKNFTIQAVGEPEEGAVDAEAEGEEGEEAEDTGNQEGKGKKDKDKDSKGKKEGDKTG